MHKTQKCHQRKAKNAESKTIHPLFHQHHYFCNYHITLADATCRAQILREHFSYRKRCCLLSVLRLGWTENRIYSVIVAAEGIYQHLKSKSNITIPLLNHAMPWLGQMNADRIKFVFRPLTVLSRTVRRKWASEPSFLYYNWHKYEDQNDVGLHCSNIYSPKKVTHNFDWFYPMCVYVYYV